jgi:hypothetical protein
VWIRQDNIVRFGEGGTRGDRQTDCDYSNWSFLLIRNPDSDHHRTSRCTPGGHLPRQSSWLGRQRACRANGPILDHHLKYASSAHYLVISSFSSPLLSTGTGTSGTPRSGGVSRAGTIPRILKYHGTLVLGQLPCVTCR